MHVIVQGTYVWKEIVKFFSGAPAKLKVAKLMVELGFGVSERGKVVCGSVEITDTSIAKAVSVDRRVVRDTVKDILSDVRMRRIFFGIRPAGCFLKEVAPEFGYGVVEMRWG